MLKIPGIGTKTAFLLYKNGIEDIGVLAMTNPDEFNISGISHTRLSCFVNDARRIINGMNSGSLTYISGINQNIIKILAKNDIYYIKELLSHNDIPEGITPDIWDILIKDAKRIMS